MRIDERETQDAYSFCLNVRHLVRAVVSAL